MRILQIETPCLAGTDVADWQTFLQSQGVLQGQIDGIFGPATAQATLDYQKKSGLAPDGVVGPKTLAQAIVDGLKSTAQVSLSGIDASEDCSRFAARIVAAGIQFVARYYSHSSHKTMSPAEARQLSNAGLLLMVVFQDKNDKVGLFTGPLGTSAGQKAFELAAAVGQPSGSAIYFAVDFDPFPVEVQGPVTDYFKAVNEVFGNTATHYDLGVYGSGLTCRLIRDAGLAKFTWLAGSSGFQESKTFRSQANVVQSATVRTLFDGQLSVDEDVAQTNAFGAFRT